jgi:proteic killer suppression protein
VIKSFRSKALAQLFATGTSRLVKPSLQSRAVMILDILDQAEVLSDLNLPGLDFHPLRGHRPKRYTIHINGPWCITFEFSDGDVHRIDLEQYH